MSLELPKTVSGCQLKIKSTYAVFSDELFREKIPFKPHLFVASLVNNDCGQKSVLLENLGFFGNSQGCIIYFSFRARVQH